MAGWIKIPLGRKVGFDTSDPSDILLAGDPAPLLIEDVYCGQTDAWIKTPLGMGVGVGPGHIVLDGDPVPSPPKRGHSPPQFSAHVYYGQTAGWIKMLPGMEVGLGPGHIVLDVDPAPPPQNGTQ